MEFELTPAGPRGTCCDANSFNSPFGWELLEDPAYAADDEIACWDSE